MRVLNQEDSCFEIVPNDSFGLDQETEFRGHMKVILAQKPSNIFINLTDLEYIDSIALGLMMVAKQI